MKNRKKILKNVGMAVFGLGLLGMGIFGVSKLVEHVNTDNTSIRLTYEVGGLDSNGKYVDDVGSLYTKEKFACEGINAVLDFESNIKYKIFYYDILNNYITSTDSLSTNFNVSSSGFEGIYPTHGAYARIEITPINDEDGKISFFEKSSYASQLNVKVSKNAESNISSRFASFKGKSMGIVDNISDLVFDTSFTFYTGSEIYWYENSSSSRNALSLTTILKVDGSETISFDKSVFSDFNDSSFRIFEFDKISSNFELNFLKYSSSQTTSYKLDENTKFVILEINSLSESFSGIENQINKAFSISK